MHSTLYCPGRCSAWHPLAKAVGGALFFVVMLFVVTVCLYVGGRSVFCMYLFSSVRTGFVQLYLFVRNLSLSLLLYGDM